MKANELMIGDWVAYIPEIEEGEDSYLGEPRNVQVDLPCLERIDELIFAPIRLTPEILIEKNGFHYFVSATPYYYNEDWDLSLMKNQGGRGFYSRLLDKIISINYVHEFQHMLRLCGLNDLADNFKV